MNTGRACKNLTDGLLVAVAILALICLVVKFVGFDGEYVMRNPSTGEQTVISSPLDDPYVMTYIKLFATFAMAAIIGFSSRGSAWIGLVASICATVISFNYFTDNIIQKFGILYVLVAIIGLAGNLVYAYYYYTEKRQCNLCGDEEISEGNTDSMKKIDFHVHIFDDIPLEESANYFKDMCARKGYEGVGLMAIWHTTDGYHRDCNEKALKLKEMIPNSYAFAALDREKDFVQQTEEYMKNGFDGIKLLEGKPSEYKVFGWGYEDERFDEFFTYAEKEQIPIMLHNNDPIDNWDMTKATPRAIEKGWVYDETVPSQEWFFGALEGALDKHRNLKIAIAHFGFYADDLDRAEALLKKCPNLYFDITPALPIYVDLCQDPARAEAFFRKYHDRLIYGTDASNNLVGAAREYNDTKTEVIKTFLEGSEPKQIGKYFVTPIRLEPYMLENIYYNNAIRFLNR